MRCGLCPAEAELRKGPRRCAECRPSNNAFARICTSCGCEHVSHQSWCVTCHAEHMRIAYRTRHGIPEDAAAGSSCEECGDVLVPAANHRRVTMIRRYCSSACRYRAKCRRRRVLRAGSPVERYAAADVFERDGWACGLCEQPVDRDVRWPDGRCATIDHVLPVSLGGADVSDNVQTAHFACNLRKGNRVSA